MMAMAGIRLLPLALLLVATLVPETLGVSPSPELCLNGDGISGPSDCVLRNSYGVWDDNLPCRFAEVRYPSSEAELVAAVAYGSKNNLKMKAVSQWVHTVAKWVCPGGDQGLVINTKNYKKISVDTTNRIAVVDSGMMLGDFYEALAEYGLTLPYAPYWDGVSVAGAIATGAHGSGFLWRGGRMGEYVRSMTVVVPDTEVNGWASLKTLAGGDDILAGRLHLGLLGVISTLTFELVPNFKRGATFYQTNASVYKGEGQ
eukprot:jgi/Mesen1/3214/ME000186S02507